MNRWIGREHVNSAQQISEKIDFSIYNVEWPALSLNFSHFDFNLWSYLQKRKYQGNPQTVTEFKEAIGNEVTSIGSEVTKAVIDRTVSNQEVITLKTGVFENLKVKNL